MNRCKNCRYYANSYGYGQCYGQKNAPRVEDDDSCENFKAMPRNNELISREELKRNEPHYDEEGYRIFYESEIDNAPTIERRPQGEWKDYSDDGFVECPFCGSATTCDGNKDELHFCWNCGAKMITEPEVKNEKRK